MVILDFEGEFVTGERKVFQTISLSKNEGNVRSATVRLNAACLSDPSAFTFLLTNDGGTNWNEVPLNTQYTFPTTGQDLRARIIGGIGEEINLVVGATRYELSVPYTIG